MEQEREHWRARGRVRLRRERQFMHDREWKRERERKRQRQYQSEWEVLNFYIYFIHSFILCLIPISTVFNAQEIRQSCYKPLTKLVCSDVKSLFRFDTNELFFESLSDLVEIRKVFLKCVGHHHLQYYLYSLMLTKKLLYYASLKLLMIRKQLFSPKNRLSCTKEKRCQRNR